MRKPILIVDDSEDTLEMFQATLQVEGFPVMTAKSGEAALELLKKHQFSLMLLDIRMPGMSGEDVLREIEQRNLAPDLPVILVSAVDHVGKLAMLPQVIDTLKKPFFYPELIYKIKSREKQNTPPPPPAVET